MTLEFAYFDHRISIGLPHRFKSDLTTWRIRVRKISMSKDPLIRGRFALYLSATDEIYSLQRRPEVTKSIPLSCQVL